LLEELRNLMSYSGGPACRAGELFVASPRPGFPQLDAEGRVICRYKTVASADRRGRTAKPSKPSTDKPELAEGCVRVEPEA